jgi:cation diffusion facilitator family transporter
MFMNGAHHHAHHAPVGELRYGEIRHVTIVGAWINAGIAVLKLVMGVLAHSQALIADGLHSLSDLLSDFLLLFAARHATKGADEEHPYGHRRIETLFSVAQGLILGGFAVGIAADAAQRLLQPDLLLKPAPAALVAAAISLAAKEWLYHYTVRAARRLRSGMLQGNAWDHRSDAISSVIVLIGVGGTLAGITSLDAVAAIAVAAFILKISWTLIWESLRELIDTGLDHERVEAIRAVINAVHGVKALHLLRTRRMGGEALVDVHILVDPRLSVSEGHQISETVRERLVREIDEVSDVMVHIDPEDDETSAPCHDLPLRAELLARLNAAWADIPEARAIEDVTLHYLDGKVRIELLLPLTAGGGVEQAASLTGRFQRASHALPEVGSVELRFR